MRTTNEGAQLAMTVAEDIARRPGPEHGVAWMDAVLLGWSQLPAGRSAIARALSELWNRQYPHQIARSLEDQAYARLRGIGFDPPDLVRQADAVAGNSAFIREQDLVAGITNWQPNALREMGLDPDRFLARVRELEGPGVAIRVEEPAAVPEADALASTLIARLEAQEPLSTVLDGARRFAMTEGYEVEASWLHFESVGAENYPKRGQTLTSGDRDGFKLYWRLHKSIDVDAVTIDNIEDFLKAGGPPRSKLADATVAELERWTVPDLPANLRNDPDLLEQWTRRKLFAQQVPSMLERIRHEIHRFLVEAQHELRARRRRLELLGPESEVVLAAGGRLLDELRNAVASLDEPTGLATAASQARTAILTMGRELHRGGKTHTSPITGKTFDIKNEKYMLRAYLDSLWEHAPADRRFLLEASHSHTETTYEIGSRAKNPFVISRDEAVRAVTSCYAVARAIALANGFPLQENLANGGSHRSQDHIDGERTDT